MDLYSEETYKGAVRARIRERNATLRTLAERIPVQYTYLSRVEEWAEKLSLDQRAELVPPKDYAKPGGTAHTMQLREYFRENVWPSLRERSKNGDL